MISAKVKNMNRLKYGPIGQLSQAAYNANDKDLITWYNRLMGFMSNYGADMPPLSIWDLLQAAAWDAPGQYDSLGPDKQQQVQAIAQEILSYYGYEYINANISNTGRMPSIPNTFDDPYQLVTNPNEIPEYDWTNLVHYMARAISDATSSRQEAMDIITSAQDNEQVLRPYLLQVATQMGPNLQYAPSQYDTILVDIVDSGYLDEMLRYLINDTPYKRWRRLQMKLLRQKKKSIRNQPSQSARSPSRKGWDQMDYNGWTGWRNSDDPNWIIIPALSNPEATLDRAYELYNETAGESVGLVSGPDDPGLGKMTYNWYSKIESDDSLPGPRMSRRPRRSRKDWEQLDDRTWVNKDLGLAVEDDPYSPSSSSWHILHTEGSDDPAVWWEDLGNQMSYGSAEIAMSVANGSKSYRRPGRKIGTGLIRTDRWEEMGWQNGQMIYYEPHFDIWVSYDGHYWTIQGTGQYGYDANDPVFDNAEEAMQYAEDTVANADMISNGPEIDQGITVYRSARKPRVSVRNQKGMRNIHQKAAQLRLVVQLKSSFHDSTFERRKSILKARMMKRIKQGRKGWELIRMGRNQRWTNPDYPDAYILIDGMWNTVTLHKNSDGNYLKEFGNNASNTLSDAQQFVASNADQFSGENVGSYDFDYSGVDYSRSLRTKAAARARNARRYKAIQGKATCSQSKRPQKSGSSGTPEVEYVQIYHDGELTYKLASSAHSATGNLIHKGSTNGNRYYLIQLPYSDSYGIIAKTGYEQYEALVWGVSIEEAQQAWLNEFGSYDGMVLAPTEEEIIDWDTEKSWHHPSQRLRNGKSAIDWRNFRGRRTVRRPRRADPSTGDLSKPGGAESDPITGLGDKLADRFGYFEGGDKVEEAVKPIIDQIQQILDDNPTITAEQLAEELMGDLFDYQVVNRRDAMDFINIIQEHLHPEQSADDTTGKESPTGTNSGTGTDQSSPPSGNASATTEAAPAGSGEPSTTGGTTDATSGTTDTTAATETTAAPDDQMTQQLKQALALAQDQGYEINAKNIVGIISDQMEADGEARLEDLPEYETWLDAAKKLIDETVPEEQKSVDVSDLIEPGGSFAMYIAQDMTGTPENDVESLLGDADFMRMEIEAYVGDNLKSLDARFNPGGLTGDEEALGRQVGTALQQMIEIPDVRETLRQVVLGKERKKARISRSDRRRS